MRLRVHPNRHWLLVLVLFEAFGLRSIATAEPVAPAKVRTITIRPPSADDHSEPLASPDDASKVHSPAIRTVRPRSAEDNGDASGQLPAAADPGHAASAADLHAVRTITIKPDRDAYPAYAPGTLPAPNSDPDRQSTHTIRDPSQFMPE
jgi:hypothetical protein